MDIFPKRVTPLQEEPQAGPSGSIPEEGIVIIGNDSCMQVIAAEDPPVGHDVEVEDSDTDDFDPVQAWANVCLCLCFSFLQKSLKSKKIVNKNFKIEKSQQN